MKSPMLGIIGLLAVIQFQFASANNVPSDPYTFQEEEMVISVCEDEQEGEQVNGQDKIKQAFPFYLYAGSSLGLTKADSLDANFTYAVAGFNGSLSLDWGPMVPSLISANLEASLENTTDTPQLLEGCVQADWNFVKKGKGEESKDLDYGFGLKYGMFRNPAMEAHPEPYEAIYVRENDVSLPFSDYVSGTGLVLNFGPFLASGAYFPREARYDLPSHQDTLFAEFATNKKRYGGAWHFRYSKGQWLQVDAGGEQDVGFTIAIYTAIFVYDQQNDNDRQVAKFGVAKTHKFHRTYGFSPDDLYCIKGEGTLFQWKGTELNLSGSLDFGDQEDDSWQSLLALQVPFSYQGVAFGGGSFGLGFDSQSEQVISVMRVVIQPR